MKYLYKYPQAAFPYDDLVRDQPPARPHEPEYELLDTGVFDDDRYFDVFVEYAKADAEDVLIQITVANRGPEARRCTCCRRCGSATPGRGRNRGKAGAEGPRRRGQHPVVQRTTPTRC
jgi:hypothetical protein